MMPTDQGLACAFLILLLCLLRFIDSLTQAHSNEKECINSVLLTGGSNSSLSCWPNCSVETGNIFALPFLSAAANDIKKLTCCLGGNH